MDKNKHEYKPHDSGQRSESKSSVVQSKSLSNLETYPVHVQQWKQTTTTKPLFHRRSSPQLPTVSRRSKHQHIGGTGNTFHFGQGQLTVKQGDITHEKADVLVNVLTEDLSLQKTRISQNFMKRCGDELQQEFDNESQDDGQIIETDACGLHHCKSIYHVPLETWKSSSSQSKLEGLLQECFQKCEDSGMKSIAFPIMGCGQLLKYPSDVVLQIMTEEAKTALKQGKLRDVKLVIFDAALCAQFIELLQPSQSKFRQFHDDDDDQPTHSQFRQFHDDVADDDQPFHSQFRQFHDDDVADDDQPFHSKFRQFHDDDYVVDNDQPSHSEFGQFHDDDVDDDDSKDAYDDGEEFNYFGGDNINYYRPKQFKSNDKSRSFTFDSKKLTVKQGDISKVTADVLVNPIQSNLSLESTRISLAFLKRGGNELKQDFQSQANLHDHSTKSILITDKIGRLKCQYVYHLPLKKWNAAEYKTLQRCIQECLTTANDNEMSSIAFPMLGYGQALRYPSDTVIECMVAEAKAFLSKSDCNLQEILFVAYESDIYQQFCRSLGDKESTFFDEDLETYEDALEDLDVIDETSTLNASIHSNSSDDRIVYGCQIAPITSHSSVRLYAKTEQKCKEVKSVLIKEFKAAFLFKEKICEEKISDLNSKAEEKIKGLSVHNNVLIIIKKRKKQISVKGERSAVSNVKSSIYKILLDSTQLKGKSSGNRLLDASLQDIRAPKYWRHFSSEISLTSIIAKIKNPFECCKIVNVGEKTFEAVSELVNKTWDSSLVGHGRDAVNLSHKSIKVTKVERVENLTLYKRYAAYRQDILREAAVKNKIIPLEKIPNSKGPIRTNLTSASLSILKKDIFPEINECYFFHGTKPEKVKAIYTGGLDSRISDSQAMFGLGVYGAESSTKADQYADPKNARSGGEKKMFLIRMTLGHILMKDKADAHTKYRRAPCTNKDCLRDNCDTHTDRYHSVVGDGQWIFREFVVYSPDQCYPEYLITYTRH